MNVWIVMDDCPSDFGEKEIIKVFASRNLAEYFTANERQKDPYKNQYYSVQKHKVNESTVIGK